MGERAEKMEDMRGAPGGSLAFVRDSDVHAGSQNSKITVNCPLTRSVQLRLRIGPGVLGLDRNAFGDALPFDSRRGKSGR